MKKLHLLILASIILFGFFGCTKNDKTTIILVGNELYVPAIEEIIPAELLDHFNFLPEGPIPPDVKGEFIADPYALSFSNIDYDIIGQARKSRYVKFSNQFNRICTFDTRQATEAIHADTIYLSGSDNYFTAYFIDYVTDDTYQTKAKTANVITGCMTNQGIKGFTYGWYLIEKVDPQEVMVPVGSMRIFTDNNDMADNFEWFSKNTANEANNSSSEWLLKSKNVNKD